MLFSLLVSVMPVLVMLPQEVFAPVAVEIAPDGVGVVPVVLRVVVRIYSKT